MTTPSIDQDEANYDIGMMYLDAGKWKDAFPFLLKAANMNHVKAVIKVIQKFQLELSDVSEHSEFQNTFEDWLMSQRELLEKNLRGVLGVGYYYLGHLLKDGSLAQGDYFKLSKQNDFILGKYCYALYQYRNKKYASAIINYRLCLQDRYFDSLPKELRGRIYNDLSLCGWYREDKEMFNKYNALAQEEDLPIAFNNRANGFFRGTIICKEPDYNSALFWYEQALERFTLSQESICKMQIDVTDRKAVY
jgi:tetratricopeptide (TPR) repeat protein